ncbi:MAG: hypothetical protein L3J49_14850 [Desulfobulbaceae bacterium]|nr:hypothetical protein [Desulfobulbaceae bacterium]
MIIKKILLIGLLAVGLSGCASSHFIEKKPDSLAVFLHLPEASRVRFASSMDQFVLHEATQDSSGTWSVTVPPSSGFTYFYIVDGSVYLPACRFRETDDFGSENCLYLP